MLLYSIVKGLVYRMKIFLCYLGVKVSLFDCVICEEWIVFIVVI